MMIRPFCFRRNNIFVLLFVLLLFAILFVPHFSKAGNLYHLLLNTSNYGIAAVGMSLLLISGTIDISYGMQVALHSILVCYFTSAFGFFPGIVLTLLAGGIIGLLNYFLIWALRETSLFVTLGTMLILKGVGSFLTNRFPAKATDPMLCALYGSTVGPIPFPILLFLLIAVGAVILLRRTRLGIGIYVAGGNAEAGKMAGLAMNHVRCTVFLLAGFCAALTGILVASHMNTGSILLGENFNLITLSSCVIGGISVSGGQGSLPRMFCGVLFIQIIQNILSLLSVPGSAQLFLTGIIVILVLLLDRNLSLNFQIRRQKQ